MNIIDALFILGVTCLVVAYFESYRRHSTEEYKRDGLWSRKIAKDHFNVTTLRFELTKEELEALPFKTVHDDEFGFGADWVTLYMIESKDEGKGHATELLREAKKYYKKAGMRFGGSIAINEIMSHIYKKLRIKEYK